METGLEDLTIDGKNIYNLWVLLQTQLYICLGADTL